MNLFSTICLFLFGPAASHRSKLLPSRQRHRACIGVRRLEERIVLDASFAVAGTDVALNNVTSDTSSITVSESTHDFNDGNGAVAVYEFQLSNGKWNGTDNAAGGIEGNGSDTLYMRQNLFSQNSLDGLIDDLQIDGSGGASNFKVLIQDNGGLDFQAIDITITARDVDVTGTGTGVQGTGTLTLSATAGSSSMLLGGTTDTGTNVFDFTDSDIQKIGSGWENITFGKAGDTTPIVVDTSGAVFGNDVTFNSTGAGSSVNVKGNLTLTSGSLLINDSAGSTTLSANITTNGGDVTINDAVVLTTNVAVTTGNSNTALNAGDVTFGGTIDSQSTVRTLTVNAGSGGTGIAGDVTFNGAIGKTTRLLGLSVTGHDVEFNDVTDGVKVTTGGVTVTNTGNTALHGDVNATNGQVLVTSAGTIDVDKLISTGTAQIKLQGGGDVTLGQLTTTSGNITVTSTGADLDVQKAITSSSGQIALEAGKNVTFGADGDVTATAGGISVKANDGFLKMLDGAQMTARTGITLNATGDITLEQLTTTVNGSITATSSNGNITVDTGNTVALQTAGTGTVTLTAHGTNSNIDVQSGIRSVSGTISLEADNNVTLGVTSNLTSTTGAVVVKAGVLPPPNGGKLTMSDGSQINARTGITLTSAGDMTLKQLTTTVNGSVSATSTAGNISVDTSNIGVTDAIQTAGTGTVTLTAQGDGSNIDVQSGIKSVSGTISLEADNNVTLGATSNLTSTAGAVVVKAGVLSAAPNGKLTMTDGAQINARTGITLTSTGDMTLKQLTTTVNGSISATTTAGDILVDTVSPIAIQTAGTGTIALTAQGSGSNINVQSGLKSVSGAITLLADNNVTMGTNGDVTSTGGNVSVTGTNGELQMNAGTLISAGAGSITLKADDAVTLGQLTTTSGTISAESQNSTLEAAAAITSGSGVITLLAKSDVTMGAAGDVTSTSGNVSVTATAGSLQMDTGTLINSGTGQIHLAAKDDITLGSLKSNNSSISVKSNEGKITAVNAVVPAVDAAGTTTVLLDAATDLDLQNSIKSASGAISLLAGDNVTMGANGDVTSTSGNVSVTATAGSLQMNGDTLINSGTGQIQLSAKGDITLGSLKSNNSSITVTSTDGKITAAAATALTVDATGTTTVLFNADTDLDVQNGIKSASGAVTLLAGNNVTMGANGDVTSTSGKVTVTADTGSLQMHSNTVINAGAGMIDLKADKDVTLGQLTTTTGAISAQSTTKDLHIAEAITSGSGPITLLANGDVTMGTAGDVTSTSGNVTITATTGSLEMDTDTLINAGTGMILLKAAGDVTLGQLKNNNSSIKAESTAGKITVNGGATSITAAGTSTVVLDAETDLDVQGGITSVSGTISLEAGNNVTLGATSNLTSTTGAVVVKAGVLPGAGDGLLTMSNGSQINARTGITLTSKGDMTLKQLTTTVNGSISATTTAGDISVDTGNTIAIQTAGTGTIALTAQGGGSNIDVQSGLKSASGAVTLTASNNVIIGADGDITSTSGNVAVTATNGFLQMNTDTVINAGSGTIALTADDDVTLGSLKSNNSSIAVTSIDGKITAAAGAALAAEGTGTTSILLDAGTDIELHNGIKSASGNITLKAADNITMDADGDITSTSGIVSVNAATGFLQMHTGTLINAGSGAIDLKAEDLVTLGQLTTTSGSITAESTGNSLDAQEAITSGSGPVTLKASNNVTMGVAGDITSTSGNVAVTATGGILQMNSGTVIDAGSGMVDLNAAGDVTLGLVKTTKTNGDAVKIVTSGAIVDGNGVNLNIDANGTGALTTLRAQTGIGSADALETSLTQLDATNAVSGDIRIQESNGITVVNLKQLNTATGDIELKATSGSITVSNGNTVAVQTHGTGTILLEAQAASGDVLVQSGIQSDLGTVELKAGRNVAFSSFGTVLTDGDAVLTAGSAITGTGAAIHVTSADLTATSGTGVTGLKTDVDTLTATVSGAGNIQILEANDITLESLQTTAGSIAVTTTQGSITVDGTAPVAVQAGGVGTVQLTAQGIASDLNVHSGISSASGAITLSAGDDVTFDNDGNVNSTSGNVSVTANNGAVILSGTAITTGGSSLTLQAHDGIDLQGLLKTTANGSISATTTTGDITVNNGLNPAVQAAGAGTVQLTAQAADSNLEVHSQISSGSGAITLKAGNDVTFEDYGDVTSTTGNISVTATAGMIGLDGTAITTGGSSLTLQAHDGIDLQGLLKTTANGAISATTTTGDITVNNGVNPAVQAAGVGTVLLDAQAVDSDLLIQSSISTASGAMTLKAGNDITFNNTGNLSSTSGNISVTANNGAVKVDGTTMTTGGSSLTLQAHDGIQLSGLLKTTVNGSVSVTTTTGDIVVDNGANPAIQTAGVGTILLDAQADTSNIDVKSKIESDLRNITLKAGNNVTLQEDGDIASNAGSVFVTATKGIITVDGTEIVTGGSAITLQADDGIQLSGLLKTTVNGSVSVTTATGDINVDNDANPAIQTAGVGTVLLDAQADSSNIDVKSRIESDLRNITLKAGNNVTLEENGDITSNAGSVFVTATKGIITVDGTEIVTGGSAITLQADKGIELSGLLKTTVNGSVSATTTTGNIIVDNGANPAIQTAGVGTVLLDAQADSSNVNVKSKIESDLRNITIKTGNNVTLEENGDITSNAGSVFVTATKGTVTVDGTEIVTGGSAITLQADKGIELSGLLKTNVNGSVSATTTTGNIVVDNGANPAIQTAGIGTVLLDAQADSSNIDVKSKIESDLRNITIKAGNNVTLEADGDVTSNSGSVFVTATKGTITVDGTEIVTGGSAITLQADKGIELSGLLKTTVNGSISATTTTGNIVVDNGTDPAIHAAGIGTVLLDAQAITSDVVVKSGIESVSRSITVKAGRNVTLESGGDLTSTAGNVIVSADQGFLKMADGAEIVTVTGTIQLTAGTDATLGLLKTGSNSLTAVAVSSGGAILDGNGSALNIDANAANAVTTLSAATGIGATDALELKVSNLKASVSGTGNIVINEVDAITLTDVNTANGSITVTAGGDITATLVKSLTDADGNDVTLTSTGGNILVAQILAGPVASDVILDASGTITGDGLGTNVTADHLQATAGTGINLQTSVNSLTAKTTAAGNIIIDEADAVTLTDVETANGSVTVTAGGNITATLVKSLTDADANDIQLTSTSGGIAVGEVNAGTTHGDVVLQALGGAITRVTGSTVNVLADNLDATAVSGIELTTTVHSLTAGVTAAGDIVINETDAITLTDIETADGAISVTAGGDIAAVLVQSLTDDDANDVTLTSNGGNITITEINVGTVAGDIILTATGSITGTGPGVNLTADDLQITAGTGINLTTSVNSLTTVITGAGNIVVNETDAITLTDLETADGSITVTAGGNITATSVKSLTDDDANDIQLTSSSGGIAVGEIDAGPLYGDVTLQALGGAITHLSGPTVNVIGDNLDATAVSGINLQTSVNSLTAAVTAAGDIVINETDAIVLTDIETADGSITVTAGGNIMATLVKSLTDADTNDINLTSTGGGIVVNEVNAGPVSGDVTLQALGGAITRASGSSINVIADDLNATAVSGIDLQTTLKSLSASVTNAGNISIVETNSITLTDVETANGSITVTAGGDIAAMLVKSITDANTNDISLTSTAGSITVTQVNAGTTAGDVILQAAGTITGTGPGVHVTADDLNATAVSGINLRTTINSLTAKVSAAGNVVIDETNAITLTDVETANGAITITSGGNMTATVVKSLTDAEANDITLTSTTGSIIAGDINAGTVNGDVVLQALGGTISRLTGSNVNITADDLNATAVSGINLKTTINSLTADVTSVGNVVIDETNAITLTDVETANGAITVTAGGNITATLVKSLTDANANDISLTSTAGSITITEVNAGTTAGDVVLNATGSITGSGLGTHVTADDLQATAGTGIDLNTTANSLTAKTTSAGNIIIDETNAITLTDVETANGSITVTAGGNIAATLVKSLTDADANDIHLTSTGGNITVTQVNAGTTAGDVILQATGSITRSGPGTLVTADDLNAVAGTGINIQTAVNSLTAKTTAAGNIVIDEANAITLTDVETANGSVTVTAGGNIAATLVKSLTDADANDIKLTSSTGNITITEVNAGTTAGDVILQASGSITGSGLGTHVTADDLNAVAGTGIHLKTALNSLTSSVTGAGNIVIDETNAITLTDVKTANGSITVTAGGNIAATLVRSLTDADANDIKLTSSTGNITVTQVNAGTTAGDVVLQAAGTITGSGPGVNVTADDLNATAVSGINLQTSINTLTASVTSAGNIVIGETNAINLTDVKTANGAITVTSGGNMTATVVKSLTDAEANDISLTSTTGSIVAGEINAGTANGDVTLQALGGTITRLTGSGINVIADDLNATAVSGIDLQTTINSLTASVTSAGNISLIETNAINLTDVKTANGAITVTAGDDINAILVRSLTDSNTNDITLTSTGGDINATSISAGTTAGDVILNAAGAITGIGPGLHVSADELIATAVTGIDLNTTINSLTGKVTASGNIQIDETNAVNLKDVETANGSITVTAGGNITATLVKSLTDTNTNDIQLTSTAGEIVVGEINAGTVDGDVKLRALGGAITRLAGSNINVIADDLDATAVSGINLYTTINDLVAFVSGTGDILIEESDDINLASSDAQTDNEKIQTTNGRIQIRAIGNITIVDSNSANDGPTRREDEEIIAGGSASSSATSAGRILLQAGNVDGSSNSSLIFQPNAQISAVDAAGDRGAITLIASGDFVFDSATNQITTYNGTDGGTLRTPIPTIDNLTGGNPDLVASGNDYKGTFNVQVGPDMAGEQGLQVYVDWGSLESTRFEGADYNYVNPQNGSLENLAGGTNLTLTHQYTISDVQSSRANGRANSTDPLQVRFTVAHDPSIVIIAKTLNGADTGKQDGSLSLLTTSNDLENDNPPRDAAAALESVLLPIQGGQVDNAPFTAVINNLITPQFAETLDAGVQTFRVPPVNPPRDFLIEEKALPELEVPTVAVADAQIIVAPVQVVSSNPAASSTTSFRDEYFQIKAISPDPNADEPLAPPERLPDDILSGDRLSQLFSQLPDGQYEIEYILGEGNERSILKFDIRQGQPVVPDGGELDGGQLKLEDITDQLKQAPAAFDGATTDATSSDSMAPAVSELSELQTLKTTGENLIAEFLSKVRQVLTGDVSNDLNAADLTTSRTDGINADQPSTTGSVGAAAGGIVLASSSFLRRPLWRKQDPASFPATRRLMQRLKGRADAGQFPDPASTSWDSE